MNNNEFKIQKSPHQSKFGLGRVKFKIILIFVFIIFGAMALYYFRSQLIRLLYQPTNTYFKEGINVTQEEFSKEKENLFEFVADNLKIPWEIAFLPDGSLLVTERPGTLKRIGEDQKIYTITEVGQVGEGGLLGMALHPRFTENRWIYIYLTYSSGDDLVNRVERYRLVNDSLSEKKIIIDNIPGATYHDGGRIAFAPDGYLYITAGDATKSSLAQDINSLAGKILRIKDDGSIPLDNPFGNAVWSYGHRNSQGLAWDDKGRLWATEHGRSGILSGFDELNLIEKGANYGWPVIQGNETKAGMKSPVIHSGPDETWAPSGAAFLDGSIFFGGLRGQALYEAKIIDADKVLLKVHFRNDWGRIRAVVSGSDGFLYLATSNTDGRGKPQINDDKIIRIKSDIFFPK